MEGGKLGGVIAFGAKGNVAVGANQQQGWGGDAERFGRSGALEQGSRGVGRKGKDLFDEVWRELSANRGGEVG